MEKRKWILGCVVLLISSMLVTQSGAQNCDSMVNLTAADNNQRVLVNRMAGTGRVCLRCLDANGEIDETGTIWSLANGATVRQGQNADGVGEYDNGMLVLLPGVLGNGRSGEYGPMTCLFGAVNIVVMKLYSSVLVPPTIPITVSRVEEFGGPVFFVCTNPNSPEVSTGGQWFNASDPSTALSMTTSLLFRNPINRTSAGEYICEVASMINGQPATTTAELIVEFAPEITFPHGPNMNLFLNDTLELTCNYVGVPMASIAEWFLNGTMCLDCIGDPRISVSTTADSSVLRIENVRRNEGGMYSCFLGNVQGNSTRTVTTILIINPPEPVTGLMVGMIDERIIPVSWSLVFDGGSPITGAIVDYVAEGEAERSVTVPGSNPLSVTLMDLTPFMFYNISVSLMNAVGTSPLMSVTNIRTLSLVLGAPTITSFTADSSTMLTVNWMPPPTLNTTEDSLDWTVEFERVVDNEMQPTSPSPLDAAVLTTSFSGLDKGTEYRVRIRGRNMRGPGNFSDYMVMQTDVDAPSMPQGITVEAINSFALNVTWMAPSDNGGRPIGQYFITVTEEGESEILANLTASSDTFNLILRSPNVTLVNSTNYDVNVAAQNTMGLVSIDATITGTTLDIEEPQQQLDPLTSPMASNRTIQLTWTNPGGFVDEYIIQYSILSSPGNVMSVTVNGTEESFLLTGLDTGTTYRVVIITVNTNGMSEPNPAAQFTTLAPDDPVVVGPMDPVIEGDTVVLRCTSPDNRVIMWSRDDGMSIDDTLVYMIMGTLNNSTLTINDVRLRNSGVFVCRVGQLTARYELNIMERTVTTTTEMPSGGIGTTTIIIAACVAGGGALLILLLVGVIILCCCCTRGDRKDQYNTKSPKSGKAPKADKRTNELFEHSTAVSYAPMESAGAQRDTGISFDMPDAFQGHSSFNTLDKPAKRSSSPEATAHTSSFGVKTASGADGSSPPRYQDMPPSYDGTVL